MVEVEPGVTWWALEERPRERGMGPTVYPISAPRSTVGDWLAENGIGVGSYEYCWLLQSILPVEAVLAGGEQSIIEGGEALRHFVGSRGSMGFVVRAWITTRRASGDMPVAASFGMQGTLGMRSWTSIEVGYRFGAWGFQILAQPRHLVAHSELCLYTVAFPWLPILGAS